jgi:hypothetical protein
VDTGAAYSVFPHKSAMKSTGPQLTGAGGKPIHCWGERELNLSFYGRRYSWTFLLADVQLPILGADFLRRNRLVVDLAAGQLLDTATMERFGPASTVGGSTLLAKLQSPPLSSETCSRSTKMLLTRMVAYRSPNMVWSTFWRPPAAQ